MGKGGFTVQDLHARDGRLKLTVVQEHGPVSFTGIIDAGVVPYGVMGGCGHVLRVGIELKYPEKKVREQIKGAALRCSAQLLTQDAVTDRLTMSSVTAEQQAVKRKREADDSDVDMPGKEQTQLNASCCANATLHLCNLLSCWSADVLGLEYSAQPRAQVILQLIGAYSVVQHPLALYLTNGAVYHRVTLIGKEVVCWRKLTPREAIHCMVQELDKV